MVDERDRHLVNFFPRLSIFDKSPLGNTPDSWRKNLFNIVNVVANQFAPSYLKEVRKGINNWVIHPDHGARHSLDVYQGARYLATQEGLKIEPNLDAYLQAGAVLHDLFQLFPTRGPKGEVLADLRIIHPEAMARTIIEVGRMVGLDWGERRDLARTVQHHDDTYKNSPYDLFSPAGKLIADADKLYGGGFERDPSELVRGTLERNKIGARGEKGWYLVREDLTPELRDNWSYGDRWYGDRVCSVRRDIFGTTFYTDSGKRIAKERREVFWLTAENFFGQEYDEMDSQRKLWYDNLNSVRVYRTSVDPKNKSAFVKEQVDTNSPVALINNLYKTHINLPRRHGSLDTAYGWMIRIEIGNKTMAIDPSVARLNSKNEFLNVVRKAFECRLFPFHSSGRFSGNVVDDS